MNPIIDIDEIFHNLDALNDVISEQQLAFQNWVERQLEEGISDEEIVSQLNSAWGKENTFKSIEEAEQWFNEIGI